MTGALYLVLTAALVTRWRGRLHGVILPLVAAGSAGWGFFHALAGRAGDFSLFSIFLAEIVFSSLWLLFILMLVQGSSASRAFLIARYSTVLLVGAILLTGIGYGVTAGAVSVHLTSILKIGSVLLALFGLVGTEQIYRNARRSQQSALKFLCLGLAAIFAYNLFLYTSALISGQINPVFWAARGYVVAMSALLIAVATHRSPKWTRGIFVSRRAAFYMVALVGAAMYLAAIWIGGYYLRKFDGDWGPAVQLILSCTALLLFFILALSDRTRAKVRVFLSKNFLDSKYDYRQEWLRLIETLTDTEDELPLSKRAIKALAEITDSNSGLLWVRDGKDLGYKCVSSWNRPPVNSLLPATHPLISFLKRSGWIVDFSDYDQNPEQYSSLEIGPDIREALQEGIVVPLFHERGLFGLIILTRPNTRFALDFEDHDLLKTAGQQVASYLANAEATEKLAESRQFEAFNKLTSYITHDLKNAMAQQSLVVENAEKHKRNPEFVDDAIETIKGSLKRMRRVISHLQQGGVDRQPQRLDMGRLLQKAVSQCADRKPEPGLSLLESDITVRADKDRMLMAVCHMIRNAQDATEGSGNITVGCSQSNGYCHVRIVDSGEGMDTTFVRDRLFRPFDSTRGSQGMGIGAYQARETLRAAGGDVEVESIQGEGTTFILTLPLVAS